MITRQKGRILSGLIVSIFIIYVGWSALIAYEYGVSIPRSARTIARHLALSAIAQAFRIYDPYVTNARLALLCPDYQKYKLEKTDNRFVYPRIESFLKKNKESLHLNFFQVGNEEIIEGRYPFYYESPHKQLAKLRQGFQLDSVIAGAKDEFEEMVLLRSWVRSRIRRIDYQKRTENFDAYSMLKNLRRSEEVGEPCADEFVPCDLFPRLFCQVMLSMGFQARLCQISHTGLGFHGVNEVWSNEYKKWITMDADLNLHYVRRNIPLNLLDVHGAIGRPHYDGLKIVQEIVDPEFQHKVTLEDMVPQHRFIDIADMRNDWLTNYYVRGHPRRSDQSALAWKDKDKRPPFTFLFRPVTSNRKNFYWTLNQVEIRVNESKAEKENGTLPLVFYTITPNFSAFCVEVDGRMKVQNDPKYEWILHPGENYLRVWTENAFGRSGIVSDVRIRLKPKSERL